MVYRNFTGSPVACFSIDLQFDHDKLSNLRFSDTEGSAKKVFLTESLHFFTLKDF